MARVFYNLSQPAHPSSIHQPHRTTLPLPNHVSLFMPSRVPSIGTAMKVVSVPSSTASADLGARGLPASTLILNEHTGEVKAIVNSRNLTALRNAAGSLLATRLLLPSDNAPRTLLAIGAGTQIQAHLSMFLSAFPTITTCLVFNRTLNARFLGLIASMKTKFPHVDFETGIVSFGCDTQGIELAKLRLEPSVARADIIITATSSAAPFFVGSTVKPGAHLCLIGSYTPTMHEIDTDLVRRAGKVVVDSRQACLTEAGEIITAGLGEADLVELGELITLDDGNDADSTPSWRPREDKIHEVQTSGDVTIFKSVGVGAQDVAIAAAVVERAERDGVGIKVDDYDV